MKNYLATLSNMSHIPAGTIYRGEGKYDFTAEVLPDTAKELRKEVADDGTVIQAKPLEAKKTRAQLRKAGLAIALPPKTKPVKPDRTAVIAARLLELETNLAAAVERLADAQTLLDTTNARIAATQAKMATDRATLTASQALLATRTTALATRQAQLAADPTNVTKQTALATAQTAYNNSVTKVATDQAKVTASEQSIADDMLQKTDRETLVQTRRDGVDTRQAMLAAFKAKRGMA